MDPTSISSDYKQVTVEVPEERLAEFHAYFARFLARRARRGRPAHPGGSHRARHGHRCGERPGAAEETETGERPETTEV